MSFWWWVLIFGAIGVVALGLFAMLGLRLWRKAKTLFADIARLTATLDTLELAMASRSSEAASGWSPEPLAIGRHRSE